MKDTSSNEDARRTCALVCPCMGARASGDAPLFAIRSSDKTFRSGFFRFFQNSPIRLYVETFHRCSISDVTEDQNVNFCNSYHSKLCTADTFSSVGLCRQWLQIHDKLRIKVSMMIRTIIFFQQLTERGTFILYMTCDHQYYREVFLSVASMKE